MEYIKHSRNDKSTHTHTDTGRRTDVRAHRVNIQFFFFIFGKIDFSVLSVCVCAILYDDCQPFRRWLCVHVCLCVCVMCVCVCVPRIYIDIRVALGWFSSYRNVWIEGFCSVFSLYYFVCTLIQLHRVKNGRRKKWRNAPIEVFMRH